MKLAENQDKINSNDRKIVLDLCGGSGSWSEPYKEAGYSVKLITLPDYDVRYWYIFGEDLIFKHQTSGNSIVVPMKNIVGILAAPPCTEFSKAKGNRYRDFRAGLEVVKACLNIIWEARIRGSLKFWALENPVGFLRQFLGKPNFTFEPYWYGALHSKRTDVWGYFDTPTKKYDELPPLVILSDKKKKNGRIRWAKMNIPICPPKYKHLKLNRAALRAITPPEFAQAFYKANKL